MSRTDGWDFFARNDTERERLRLLDEAASGFAAEAEAADRDNRLPHANIERLRSIGYPAWPVPPEYGGLGISLHELVLYQERLGSHDPATALGIGWHVGIVFDLAHKRPWDESVFARLCRDIAARGALTNRMASEAATGSPSRGGRPLTTATPTDGGYRIYGRKNFATLSPVIDHFIVSAVIDGTDTQAEFLIPRDSEGLSIEETWNTLGMRGTASHDLVLDGVHVPREALVHTLGADYSLPSPYLLHIPACYLGIALAAKREAQLFARQYQPNSLPHPILHAPNVGELLGRIELELRSARHFVYSVADRWDRGLYDGRNDQLSADLGAAKVIAIQAAMRVVDLALRITGVHGLNLDHPLQRLYRDVRFGLHNPPMEDGVVRQLAKLAVNEAEALDIGRSG
mgnify:CR=1 FL=1